VRNQIDHAPNHYSGSSFDNTSIRRRARIRYCREEGDLFGNFDCCRTRTCRSDRSRHPVHQPFRRLDSRCQYLSLSGFPYRSGLLCLSDFLDNRFRDRSLEGLARSVHILSETRFRSINAPTCHRCCSTSIHCKEKRKGRELY